MTGEHPLTIYEPAGWREAAACLDYEADLFFPLSDDPRDTVTAKAVCAGCTVREECLAFAIETGQADGIWGGLTPSERRRLRQRWLRQVPRAS